MPKVSVASVESASKVPPPPGSDTGVETRALFARENDPIHVFVHKVPENAALRIEGAPSDKLVYVWKGALRAGDVSLDAGSIAIVEFKSGLTLHADEAGAEIISFGVTRRSDDACEGGHVHLLPSRDVPRAEEVNGMDMGSALYADAQCPTCRVWLHENDYRGAGDETGVHSHSEDEVIFVVDGTIKLGNRLSGPGTAIAVAANTKYGVAAGPGGMRFINFRGASPTYSAADGSLVVDEGEFWRATVGKPQYIEARDASAAA